MFDIMSLLHTETSICNNGFAQIQRWKSPLWKLRGEREYENSMQSWITYTFNLWQEGFLCFYICFFLYISIHG